MMTVVMILANRGIGMAALVVVSVVLFPLVLNWILGVEKKTNPGQNPRDSIGTKLRRLRDCRTVRCGRADCNTWNPARARFCRHCGEPLQ